MWSEFEQITEKKWLQILNIIVDLIKTDHFLRQYETYREKVSQQYHNSLMVSSDKDYGDY
jgi:hypothetical protein